jgi:NAD(P)-dependent dehydrogenase (short-subunit alcohol dehydrogenase family)
MLGEFSNKIAVVTGGSRGIGREIALELASSGAQTVIVSSSADNLAGAAKIIAAAGPRLSSSPRICAHWKGVRRFLTV